MLEQRAWKYVTGAGERKMSKMRERSTGSDRDMQSETEVEGKEDRKFERRGNS